MECMGRKPQNRSRPGFSAIHYNTSIQNMMKKLREGWNCCLFCSLLCALHRRQCPACSRNWKMYFTGTQFDHFPKASWGFLYQWLTFAIYTVFVVSMYSLFAFPSRMWVLFYSPDIPHNYATSYIWCLMHYPNILGWKQVWKCLDEFTSYFLGVVKGTHHIVEASDVDVSFVHPQN